MSTTTAALTRTASRPRGRAAVAMLRTEALLFLREPVQLFFAIPFPALLVVALGRLMPAFTEPAPEYGGVRGIDVYVPVAIALAIATVSMVSLAGVVSAYREQGVLRRLATTPVGAHRVLGASLVVHAGALLLAAVLVVLTGRLVFDVPLPENPLGVLLAVVLGTAAMCAVGVCVAAVAPNARAATGIGTIVYFPMMFFGGVWTPGPMMPEMAQRVGELTPLGASSQAMQASWEGGAPSVLQVVVMVVWTAVAFVGATRLFRWE